MGEKHPVKDFITLLRHFSPYFGEYKRKLFLAILGMVMTAAGTALTAYLIKPVLDRIFIEKNEHLLYILPFGIVAVYALKSLGTYLQAYYSAYIGQDIVRRIRDKLVRRILSFEIGFFHTMRSGELISRSVNDVERVRNVVSNMIPIMIRELLTIVFLTAYIFYLNPKMALISIVFIPLAAKPLSILTKKMKRLSTSSQEMLSNLTARLSEIFNNIEMIKANSVENFESARFEKENLKIFKVNMKAVRTTELVTPIMEILGAVAAAAVIIMGGQEVIEGHLSVGSFFSFLTALFMLYTPIKKVSRLFNQIQDAIAANERIQQLLQRHPQIKDGTKELNEEIRNLTFDHVTLSYDGEKKALEDISFEVHRGEKVALVGNSGGGKSSIVNMMLRFYEPQSGTIRFNETSIDEYNLKSLRRHISIVTQRVYILNDTVAANVAYGEKIDKERVIKALKDANAWDFIRQLPEGIDTGINEFGTNFSGGQRQRIAIARAIYRDPQIFIFDEATSALDTESEQKITDAINRIAKEKITFIIAHRMNSIVHADKIFVLKEGKLVCKGNNSELLKHCSEFKLLKGLQ